MLKMNLRTAGLCGGVFPLLNGTFQGVTEGLLNSEDTGSSENNIKIKIAYALHNRLYAFI